MYHRKLHNANSISIIKQMNRKDIIHLVLAIVFIGISINVTITTINIFKNTNRLKELEKEVVLLEEEKDQIQSSIEYKKTNEYVEDFARNELNMVKPGEEVFVVVKTGNNINSGTEITNLKLGNDDKNVFSLWINLFFE